MKINYVNKHWQSVRWNEQFVVIQWYINKEVLGQTVSDEKKACTLVWTWSEDVFVTWLIFCFFLCKTHIIFVTFKYDAVKLIHWTHTHRSQLFIVSHKFGCIFSYSLIYSIPPVQNRLIFHTHERLSQSISKS